MVGGFVQQQDVRVGKQGLGQQNAEFPARRHGAHRAGVLVQGNADAEQQFTGACFCGIAIVFGEFHFQFGDLHAVIFAHLRQCIDPVAFVFHAPQFLMAHDYGIQHAEFLVGELVLAQTAQALVGVQGHIAGGGRQLTREDLHQRGLAAAVGTDQTIAVAIGKLDGNVFEQGLGPELHGDIGGG